MGAAARCLAVRFGAWVLVPLLGAAARCVAVWLLNLGAAAAPGPRCRGAATNIFRYVGSMLG